MKPRRSVEVFNLSGYLQQLPKQDEKAVSENVNMLEVVINQTLEQLKPEGFSDEDGPYPDFQFHRGANLFIVIGPPIAIEVARKVVNALPGQQSGGDRIIIDPATGLPIDPATGLPLAARPAPAAPPPGPKPRP